MRNIVMWAEFAKTCKASLDTVTYMNGLLKKKIVNLDYSLNTCQEQVVKLNKTVTEDNAIIVEKNLQIAKKDKKIANQGKTMKILLPILSAVVVIETIIIVVK